MGIKSRSRDCSGPLVLWRRPFFAVVLFLTLLCCSRGERFTGSSPSTNQSEGNGFSKSDPVRQDTLNTDPTDDPSRGDRDPILPEEGPQDPGARSISRYASQISSDTALVPIGISASVEGQSGDYYYFSPTSVQSSGRLVCRSVRRAPDGPKDRILSLPCVLSMPGDGPYTWVHKTIDKEQYRWNFATENCPEVTLEGTNLWPQEEAPHLLTPATIVKIPDRLIDYCLASQTTLSLVVSHKTTQETTTYSTQLQILWNHLPTITHGSTMTSEMDTATNMAAAGGSLIFRDDRLKNLRRFVLQPANPGTESDIICPETFTYVLSKMHYVFCRPSRLPDAQFTRWKILVTNCQGLDIEGNALYPEADADQTRIRPAALLKAELSTLDQCSASGRTEVLFYVETDDQKGPYIYRGILRQL